ncbi:MAG: ABC transporter ATP-binding protein [Planctomycetota bacterium]
MTPRLQVRELHKSYPGQDVLCGLDLDVAAGEVVAVQGASGTGKSTLLNCIGLLDRPDAGRIDLDGLRVDDSPIDRRSWLRANRLGFIFQGFHLLPEFDVLENVLMAARCAGRPPARWQARAQELLERVDLATHRHARPGTLSGGERQRVAICRALLLQPPLLLADEPTGNLDPATGRAVQDLLHGLASDSGAGVVLVTHDAGLAERCDRVLELRQGLLHQPVRG